MHQADYVLDRIFGYSDRRWGFCFDQTNTQEGAPTLEGGLNLLELSLARYRVICNIFFPGQLPPIQAAYFLPSRVL